MLNLLTMAQKTRVTASCLEFGFDSCITCGMASAGVGAECLAVLKSL